MQVTAADAPADDLAERLARFIANAPFREYASRAIKIEDERGKIVPFHINEAQQVVDEEIERQRAAGRPIRVLILKGRQQGMSTYCQARLAWRAFRKPGARCVTVGHALGAVHELYGKFERAWRELPDEDGLRLRPTVESREQGRRLVFADPQRSSYRADSAHEPEKVGRGLTAQYVHLTEIPQWPKADETMQAILAVVPEHADTEILVESTAKGATGWFYEMFAEGMRQLSRGEEPDFVPVFVPWFKTERYRRKYRPGEPRLSPAESKFKEQYDLDTEQVLWYRDQRRRFGDRVTEEYPSNWREAFLSSGLPYFQADARERIREHLRQRGPALKRGQFVTYEVGHVKKSAFKDSPDGPTRIYEAPVPEHRYVLGVDFASGRNHDNSAIIVLDVDTEQVVATHRSKLAPDDVLIEAIQLGKRFNNGLIVPERSGIGQALVDRLVREYRYPNVYRERDEAAVRYSKGSRWGLATSNRNRPSMLEELAHRIHTDQLGIPDDRILAELDSFVFTKDDDTRAEAEAGKWDDMVMALAFAVRGMADVPPPSSPRLTPERSKPRISSRTGF